MSITLTGVVSKLVRTTVTDIVIEQSFRIIYDSLTARRAAVDFRLYPSDLQRFREKSAATTKNDSLERAELSAARSCAPCQDI